MTFVSFTGTLLLFMLFMFVVGNQLVATSIKWIDTLIKTYKMKPRD